METATAQSTRPLARLLLTVCLLLFGWASTSHAGPIAVLGQTASMNVIVDGSPVLSGTTLLSPSVLETQSGPARVFLAHGQILELERDTRAHLQAAPSGELEVAVDNGTVVVYGSEGEQVEAAASQRLVFVRPQIQVAQLGGPGRAALALPIVVLAAGCCAVDANGLCSPEDDTCSDKGGTCECVKRDEATGVCEECSCKVPAAPPPSHLGTGVKIAIGIGIGIGVAILIDELDDDDEPPASPVN